MTKNTTELREAINEVVIEGKLREKNIEEATIDTKDGKAEVIRGEIIVATGENAEHRIRVFANKLTKDKKENSVYKGLHTVMEDYVSIAEALKSGLTEDEATKVRITKGKLGLNEFYTPTGELRSFPVISTNFINRVQGEFNPRAEFSLELFFESLSHEIVNEEETGRLVVKGIVPIYGGKVIPLTLYAPKGEIADYLDSTYEVNRTGKVWGEVINEVEITKTIEKGFGKAKEKIISNIKHELLITGGDEEQYDEENTNSYSVEVIRKALADRDIYLDSLLDKSQSAKSNAKSNASTSGKKNFKF